MENGGPNHAAYCTKSQPQFVIIVAIFTSVLRATNHVMFAPANVCLRIDLVVDGIKQC